MLKGYMFALMCACRFFLLLSSPVHSSVISPPLSLCPPPPSSHPPCAPMHRLSFLVSMSSAVAPAPRPPNLLPLQPSPLFCFSLFTPPGAQCALQLLLSRSLQFPIFVSFCLHFYIFPLTCFLPVHFQIFLTLRIGCGIFFKKSYKFTESYTA